MTLKSVNKGSLKQNILVEVLVLWLVVNLLIRAAKMLYELANVHEAVLIVVPILFMYGPVLSCRLRGEDSNAYPITLPSFSERKVWADVWKYNAILVGVITPPFLVVYHLWHTQVLGIEFRGTLPQGMWWENVWTLMTIVGFHLFFVGIPEEFFYRGYLQSRLDQLWEPKSSWFGAPVGRSLIFTSLIFAFGHSIVEFQWWHFAIFVPSLAFGWLRAKTGDVMAGAFFHAWCNVLATVLEKLYGLSTW